MKQYILTGALAIASSFTSINAGNVIEVPDTLVNINTPSTVLITETPQGINLSIKSGNNSESSFLIADYKGNATVSVDQKTSVSHKFSSKGYDVVNSSSGWSLFSGGLNFGLVNSIDQPDGMDLRWAKSIEIGWLNTLGVRYSHKSMSVSLGIGLDWRNYNMTTRNHRMVHDSTTGIALAPYPEGAIPGNSRINVFSLGFPLLYTQHIPGTTLSLTAGGIFNVNTHGSLKTKYTDELGNEIEEHSSGIHRRVVSFDVYGSIHLYKAVSIYARYSPQTVLSGAGVPKFKPLSVGISLFM